MSQSPAKKVAILGGGISSITVALLLTDDPNWRQKFCDITIYQMGWRLGGKGATGRGNHDRIQEHGLHIWLGFYENAFRIIQKVYADLGRAPDEPFATWKHAFSPHNFIGVTDNHGGHWHPCLFPMPDDKSTPGDPTPVPSFEDCHLEALRRLLAAGVKYITDPVGVEILRQISLIVYPNPGTTTESRSDEDEQKLIGFLLDLTDHIERILPSVAPRSHSRCVLIFLSTVATMVRGVLRDQIGTAHDLERLENEDFARWLDRHGASSTIHDVTRNPYLRGMYDFAFAYKDGDVRKPLFAAGPALRTIYRMLLTYKGSVIYKMEAGMGDTIFAPAYDLLVKRGVKFRFFHKVKNLGLSPDKRQIETIDLGVQATPKNAPYDPLVEVHCDGYQKKLRCWPEHPKFQDLCEGKVLEGRKIDLESFWTDWPDVSTVRLKKGTDFDDVVFGIPIGSIPYVCGELLAESKDWRAMVAHVRTVATQAVQLWIEPTLRALGWQHDGPVLDAWIQPLNTWADMTNLLDHKRENWPPARPPRTLAYFCGPLEGPIAPPNDIGFPQREYMRVDRNRQRLYTDLRTLWPYWQPASQVISHFQKANIDPSERYVLSLPGSARYRLWANQAGFSNLVLTGDWIRTRYNAGCIEAATWAGIQAANTLLGRPLEDGILY
jgi:uncharacterized protein with NAD-binding domain and iron-sulfur cluster